MERFSEPTQGVLDLLTQVRSERFNHLEDISIKVIMDNKPRVSKVDGKVTFAYIKVVNEVEDFLISDDQYEYLLFLITTPWDLASTEDKVRIISHELRHIFIDERGKCRIIKHEIQDFYDEVELNSDDPRWGERLALSVKSALDV